MAKKSRRLRYECFDIGTLETAHRHFMVLADAQPGGEIKDALRLAAKITHTLQIAVGAAYDLRGFFEDIMGGIDGRKRR